MKNTREEFGEEFKIINELIKTNNINIGKLEGTPAGVISTTKKGKSYQYSFKGVNDDRAKYLKTSERDLAQKVVQLDYERKVGKLLKRKQNAITAAFRYFDCGNVTDIYEQMGEGRRQLVSPILMPTDEYINKWYGEHPGNQNTYPLTTGYETDKGEKVRSKSEKIIADMLNKHGIPYSYESKLQIGMNKVIFPDFLVLNKKERRTYVWEHLGLIDTADYAVRNLNKLAHYEEAGYMVGQELIITMESENIPLNIKMVEKKINDYLL